MKTDFLTVIFNDECRAILDGPSIWDSGWILHGNSQPTKQGSGGVMFWISIVGRKIIGPFIFYNWYPYKRRELL